MTILTRPRSTVQLSNPPRDPWDSWPAWADQHWTIPAGPEVEPAAFVPDSDDLAWDTGFTIGLEDGAYDLPRGSSARAELNFACGKLAGRRAREAAEARGLGEAMGYAEAAPEPPGGYGPHEAAAFREGYAAGLARFEEEREYEAWLDTLAAERAEEIPAVGISDAEMWPGGVC